MATNRYFNNFPSQERINNEHLLMEDLIVESIQIMGHNVYYIPRESFDEGDMIFGEYSKSAFNKAYLIEAYLANVEGFEGQGDFFSKFGLEIRDTSNFILSRRSFRNVLPGSLRQRPQEGDLVYVPVFHKMFEIKFIEHQLMFHSIGKKLPYVYEMRCEAFRGSQETLNTGVEEIDNVSAENNYTMLLSLTEGSAPADFLIGETVFQATNNNISTAFAYAVVKEWFAANNNVLIYDIRGQFTTSANLIGQTTGANWRTTVVNDKSDNNYYDFFDNKKVDDQADPILDLSEFNPFGTP